MSFYRTRQRQLREPHVFPRRDGVVLRPGASRLERRLGGWFMREAAGYRGVGDYTCLACIQGRRGGRGIERGRSMRLDARTFFATWNQTSKICPGSFTSSATAVVQDPGAASNLATQQVAGDWITLISDLARADFVVFIPYLYFLCRILVPS